MHQTRKSSSTKLPIERKGTKYIARASSHILDSVPVVIAVRDMLKLAKTAKEVKKMINQKILKINGHVVKDYRESILIFNIFQAGKSYELSVLPTKKFVLNETKNKDQRLCKVINKRLVKSKVIQLNLHDGTNVLTKEKIKVGDSVYLDLNNKIKKHIPIEKGKDVFVFSGTYSGFEGKIQEIKDNKVIVKINGDSANLDKKAVVAT